MGYRARMKKAASCHPAVMSAEELPHRVYVPEERRRVLRARLARARGQIEGIERMLDGNRPCVEVLGQISAAQNALRAAGRDMVKNYLEQCVTAGSRAGKSEEIYDELLRVIFQMTR
jgi:DNA-binding FrmR family transcriptional regulator